MTQKDIIEVLENTQNKIEKTGDEKSKEILFVLYNLIGIHHLIRKVVYTFFKNICFKQTSAVTK